MELKTLKMIDVLKGKVTLSEDEFLSLSDEQVAELKSLDTKNEYFENFESRKEKEELKITKDSEESEEEKEEESEEKEEVEEKEEDKEEKKEDEVEEKSDTNIITKKELKKLKKEFSDFKKNTIEKNSLSSTKKEIKGEFPDVLKSIVASGKYIGRKIDDETIKRATMTTSTGSSAVPLNIVSEIFELEQPQNQLQNEVNRQIITEGNQCRFVKGTQSTGQIIAEGTTITADNTSAISNVTATIEKYNCNSSVTQEMLEDANFNVTQYLSENLRRGINNLVEEKLVEVINSGIDSSNKLKTGVSTVSGKLNKVTWNDLVGMSATVIKDSNSTLVLHPTVRSFLSAIVDTNGRPIFVADLTTAGNIGGLRVIESSALDSAVTVNNSSSSKVIALFSNWKNTVGFAIKPSSNRLEIFRNTTLDGWNIQAFFRAKSIVIQGGEIVSLSTKV